MMLEKIETSHSSSKMSQRSKNYHSHQPNETLTQIIIKKHPNLFLQFNVNQLKTKAQNVKLHAV